jgi:hypothetical protein
MGQSRLNNVGVVGVPDVKPAGDQVQGRSEYYAKCLLI